MTVNQILKIGLINDNTKVIIRDGQFQILSHGNWYQDEVLNFADYQVESFTWQDDNKVYIDVKQ